MADSYFFLDTEWADLSGRELVSLALVSHDGMAVFYAERDPLPAEATGFVRDSVFPLLDRGSTALSDREFTQKLRAFLCLVPNPHVLYDYANDGVLLLMALAGFGLLPSELGDSVAPRHLKSSLLKDDFLSAALEDYFLAHPDEASRRHHALVDARALRAAWLASRTPGIEACPSEPSSHDR